MSDDPDEFGSARETPLSSSLLVRVKSQDAEAWRRLVALYSPLVYRWCRRAGLHPDEAMDVMQDVFRAVVIAIGRFRSDREGDAFQGWLRTITRNKIRDFFRAAAQRPQAVGGSEGQRRLDDLVADLERADPPDAVADSHAVVIRALELVRAEFEEITWTACWRTTVDEEPPAAVAAAMGMTVGAVYKAKSRVLARLRAELEGLVDL